jgi:hypothetical protein
MKFEGILIIIIKKKRVTLSNVNVSLVAVHNSTSSCLLGHVGALETKSQYIYIYFVVQMSNCQPWRDEDILGGGGLMGYIHPWPWSFYICILLIIGPWDMWPCGGTWNKKSKILIISIFFFFFFLLSKQNSKIGFSQDQDRTTILNHKAKNMPRKFLTKFEFLNQNLINFFFFFRPFLSIETPKKCDILSR